MKRLPLPGWPSFIAATASDADALTSGLHGYRHNAVTFTKGQWGHLCRVYDSRSYGIRPLRGYHVADAESGAPLMMDGAYYTVGQCATIDGLRLMALLSTVLEPGEDPVGFVLRLLHETGRTGGTTYLAPEDEGVQSLDGVEDET